MLKLKDIFLKEETTLEEANYPENFNVEEFKRLPSFKERVQYAKERLAHVGTGSARVVFNADDKTVLKVAKNKKGIAQNNLEIELAGYYDTRDIVANILESGDNGFWIEAERGEKMTDKKFAAVNGFSFEAFKTKILTYSFRGNKSNYYNATTMTQEENEIIENSELFTNIIQFIESYDMGTGDITRLSSWGIVNRNGINHCILVDYGYNKEIQDSFYSPKKITY